MTADPPFARVFAEQDGTEDDWPGLLLVSHGKLEIVDQRLLTRSYWDAAEHALDRALRDLDLGPEAAYPALFLIRHAIELYLKGIVPDWDTIGDRRNRHRIDTLVATMRDRLADEYDAGQVETLCAFLLRFHDLDPKAMAFRYRDGATASFPDPDVVEPEIWVDLVALRDAVSLAFEALERVWLTQPREP